MTRTTPKYFYNQREIKTTRILDQQLNLTTIKSIESYKTRFYQEQPQKEFLKK